MRRFMPIVALLIMVLGGISAWYFIETSPKSKRVKPPVSSPLVITSPVSKGTAILHVGALGTVKAAQETTVQVRVSGQVEELGKHFEIGAIVPKGELLVQLDKADYENALALQKSLLASAKADYDLEMGQQRVAKTELEQIAKVLPETLTNGSVDTAIALRAPQLAQAKASMQSAEVNVRQAVLDLERTRIVAPYNALVIERAVSLGSQASTSDNLGSLVGTDAYYIEAAVALDKLQGLGLRVFDGAPVRVFSSSGVVRQGTVLHAIANIDETTRMGRVLVEVKDPLGLDSGEASLLLGEHVRMELEAGELNDVVVLPRSALRDNNTVWVLGAPTQDGVANQFSLDIRKVTPVWKDTETVFIGDGLEGGEDIITSPLSASIHGMPVRLMSGTSVSEKPALENGEKPERPEGRPEGNEGRPAGKPDQGVEQGSRHE